MIATVVHLVGSALFGVLLAHCGLYVRNWRTWVLICAANAWVVAVRLASAT